MNQTMLETITVISVIILLIILLPHITRLLIWLFKTNKFNSLGSSTQLRLIHQLYESVLQLSETKTGAIITLVNKDNLDKLRTDGILINANISSLLIISIFNKKSPLHDGALIIEGGKIKYVATYFKITQASVNNKYGARHRAALGISEQSDSITIIVSEETGGISIARNSKLTKVKINNLQEELIKILQD
ncbi:MAG: diadenylate cyclase [Mycoplasma sp.]|nr:diadenylate cyclase [Mycoplasma sp.]